MNESAVRALVEHEFGALAEGFAWYSMSVDAARTSTDIGVSQPGVYIFLRGTEPMKVGRHLQNSRKRALEHIRDNTGGEIADLEQNPEARLILINARDPEKLHWVVALEVFLEFELKPKVRSKRTG